MRKLQLLFVFTLLAGLVKAQNDVYKTITVDGRERKYIIHLPPGYEAAKNLPVLFGLHGGSGNNENTIKFYNLNDLADKNNFIAIYPNAVAGSWTMPGFAARTKNADSTVDDVHFISVLLDTIIRNYKGDPSHVFTTGISRGGEFSLFLAYKLSKRITAIAPVCASVPKTVLKAYSFNHPTPVLLINGTDDPLIKYDGGFGKYLGTDEPGDGFDMASTDDVIKKIVTLNLCSPGPKTIDMPNNDPNDGCNATKYSYTCNSVNVTLIKITNGGHTWAGGKQYLPKSMIGKVCRDFNAEDEIFNFFLGIINK
ncbi:MAG TPA: alpha/beta hydrolase-fold protein [Bacteroidia bacterium]|jgi:polyhydroxybutyrate depolymerase|nr:alpha/beta hydrolase-fold protein [Bacteroidia bacterium]